jgi:hypothetical protein
VQYGLAEIACRGASKTGLLRCAEGVWECPKGRSWRRPERSGGRRNDWPLGLRAPNLRS